jgi:cytochrome c-type biogenesis protein CcmE
MRLRWLILAFLLIPLVGGAWVYRTTHKPRPVLVKIDALLSPEGSGRSSRPVAVIGKLQPSSRYNKGSSEWWFTLEDEGRVMPVHYTGRVPSTFFEEGAKVLVTGTMREGTFSAGSLAVRVWM